MANKYLLTDLLTLSQLIMMMIDATLRNEEDAANASINLYFSLSSVLGWLLNRIDFIEVSDER